MADDENPLNTAPSLFSLSLSFFYKCFQKNNTAETEPKVPEKKIPVAVELLSSKILSNTRISQEDSNFRGNDRRKLYKS
ncbi:hypothetical protein glysoja_004033 [Glycine soja]|nr:hypothetical protein glysoja_004033 [Glycine soja]